MHTLYKEGDSCCVLAVCVQGLADVFALIRHVH